MSKKVTVSHGQIIDERCNYKNGELVVHNNEVYSCTLNQTDIKTNKNKFYIMQLLKDGKRWVLYKRYGRIGEPGKVIEDPYSSEASGRTAFEKQFKSKTKNAWSKKDDFKKYSGKYFLSEISYEEVKDVPDKPNTNIPDSKLEPKVVELLKMLSNIDMIKQTLVELEIDTKKLPLGKITKRQINKAKKLLQSLSSKVSAKGGTLTAKDKQTLLDEITDLSSEYYTLIPLACGRRKPPVIEDSDIVNKYYSILSDLESMVVTAKIIENVETKVDQNPIDALYEDINTTIKHVDPTSEIYAEMDKYIRNTHGKTHYCKIKMIDMYEIKQHGKKAKYDRYSKKIGNPTLLFHGTPQSCVLSIFKNDFYINPNSLKDSNKIGVKITGRMFGDGVYFADMATKSFNYTRAQATNGIGCLIMGEVAVGKQYERYAADYYINKKKLKDVGCHSAKGVGRWAPGSSTVVDGVTIPNGEVKDHQGDFSTVLRYNEHIIYDPKQVNIRYLVLVKNTGRYGGY